MTYRKNIQDIVKDRTIIKMQNQSFASLDYEVWEVELPIYFDVVESLLENGFLISMVKPNRILVARKILPSPEQIQKNKKFWRELKRAFG
jgi:uncharacterized integral membrane protein